jgi:hypothetical protein
MNLFLALIQALVVITAPATGDTLVGTVTISGTAASPNFDHYELAFAYDPNTTDTWFEVVPPSNTPVTNGQLGTWDTTGITDGTYMLRLRVYNTGSTAPTDVIVRNLVIGNNAPTPAAPPTGAPTSSFPIATLAPTAAGPVSTPQSTTAALEPTAATVPVEPTTESPFSSLSTFLNLPSYFSAFCNGVYLTLGVFVVLGAYVVVRDRIRRPIRKWLRRVVSDIRKP